MNRTQASSNSEIEFLIRELKSTYPVSSRYSNAIPEDDYFEYSAASADADDIVDIGIDADYAFNDSH